MSLLDKLNNTWLGFKGMRPFITAGSLPNSTLHNTSSINNIPSIKRKPSTLDLDGKTPRTYKDDAPKGARF